LTVLNHYTGLWGEDDDDDDNGKDGSTGSSEQDEEARAPSSSTKHFFGEGKEKVSLAGLWQEIPKVYVLSFRSRISLDDLGNHCPLSPWRKGVDRGSLLFVFGLCHFRRVGRHRVQPELPASILSKLK
jgi:hypothetical protein